MKIRNYFVLIGLAMLLLWGGAACGGEEGLTEADVIASVEAAVAATNAAQPATATAVTDIAAASPEATWTPIPAVNVDTPTPANTQPPPPTNTPLPTVPPPTPTETPFIPTNTPVPTATAVPPTNTPLPPAPQPTAPPAEPTVPPNPVYGSNILVNGSFEDGWYNASGIAELQLPNNWVMEYDEGPTGFGSESWDNYVRPETRVLPAVQLPPEEQSLFIRDGQYTIKMFKGFGAISFRFFQEITLPAGSYRFQIYVYPDLVEGYDGGKIFASDPLAGEIRFIAPDGGTGWLLPAFGTWNTLEHTFSLSEQQTVRVGAGFRGRYALSNNGWFFDQWSLQRIEN
jgi:hypothetical protein